MMDIVEMIKEKIHGGMDGADQEDLNIMVPRDKNHGDYTTNIALKMGKKSKTNPMDRAKDIVHKIGEDPMFDRIIIEEPGFINFFCSRDIYDQMLDTMDHPPGAALKDMDPSGFSEKFLSRERVESLQYIHYRISAILKILGNEGFDMDNIKIQGLDHRNGLPGNLIKKMAHYSQIIKKTTHSGDYGVLTDYMVELGETFCALDEETLYRELDRNTLGDILKIINTLNRMIKGFLEHAMISKKIK